MKRGEMTNYEYSISGSFVIEGEVKAADKDEVKEIVLAYVRENFTNFKITKFKASTVKQNGVE